MLFWLLIILCVAGFIYGTYKNNIELALGFIPVGILMSMLGLLIVCLIFSGTIFNKDTVTVVKTVKTPIVSLTPQPGMSGSFFLGSGTIDSVNSYIFMKDLGDNKYLQGSYPTGSIIIEESNETPSFTYDTVKLHTDPRMRYLVPLSFTSNGIEYNVNYRLIVPKNTLTIHYNVN